MAFVATALMLLLTAGESAKRPTKDARGTEELCCEKIKIVEVADDQDGKVEIRTPAEIPLDKKLVTIRKNAISVQPVMDRGEPSIDLQTFRIVNAGHTSVHAIQESATNVTALALDRLAAWPPNHRSRWQGQKQGQEYSHGRMQERSFFLFTDVAARCSGSIPPAFSGR